MRAVRAWLWLIASLLAPSGCSAPPPTLAPMTVKSVLLITIDTLRADHVGAYGGTAARTPALDALARAGAVATHAYATAPITLTSHASLLTGRYPPGHGARHNGIAMRQDIPTLAAAMKSAGVATGAFVSAFPLDRRFGLAGGFDVYDDELPAIANGSPADERRGRETVDRAVAWLDDHRAGRFFLWVHLFEPHAPYGSPDSGARSAAARYAEDVERADREVGRLVAALGDAAPATLVLAAGDHGEAFGEHGEISHSVFVYDTTLRVPLIMRGPGIRPGRAVAQDLSLVDVAPTIAELAGIPGFDTDGRSFAPALGEASGAGQGSGTRALYAESFAPQLDFGWAGLRTIREGRWKYIAAPRPELYDVVADPGERDNRVDREPQTASRLEAMAARWSPAELGLSAPVRGEAVDRLRSLGYFSGRPGTASTGHRADPKDRVALAAKIATVTSGEVSGEALVATLRAILREDAGNPQIELRLGFAELSQGRCGQAEPHLRAAIASGVPTADAGIGLADCRGRAGDLDGAAAALAAAQRVEPGNPVVAANLGLLALEKGQVAVAVKELRAAISRSPGLLEARFGLARALARSGDRVGAAAEASTLLAMLPPGAPQRREVERLLASLR